MSVTLPKQSTSEPSTPARVALSVEHLSLVVDTARGPVQLLDDVSFEVREGETLGLVGESGSGKTMTSLAITRLLPRNVRIAGGAVRLGDQDLVGLSEKRMRAVRGSEVAMVFQEPLTSLNPAFTIGNQITEMVRAHESVSRTAAAARAVEMLALVGIPEPQKRYHDYPHAFSGGMRQRAMIAMALVCHPRLLIADEPTTALDVTIQAQILELLRSLQREFGTAMLFVTHDLGVVADVCDRVCVLYAGQAVEQADVESLFSHPCHPYTDGLLRSVPRAADPGTRLVTIPGTVPAPDLMPPGCRFAPRCAHSTSECVGAVPQLEPSMTGGITRCCRHHELRLGGSE
jgi:peptide/nickel transport system ATP-binding protein